MSIQYLYSIGKVHKILRFETVFHDSASDCTKLTLALTINPYTPEYQCTPQRLLDVLVKELPTGHPPIIDVVSGLEE